MPQELTKKDVVVVALALLGGGRAPVDTEDVAIAAHALAPAPFGWRKHTEHIDLDVVRTSLRHEKESPAARIDGSVRTGWHLTPSGQAWLAANPGLTDAGATLAVADTPAAVGKRRAETRETSTALDRVRTSRAFKAWAAGQAFDEREAGAVFRIDEYTPARERTLKTARLNDLAAGDPTVAHFLAQAIPLALGLRAPVPTSDPQENR